MEWQKYYVELSFAYFLFLSFLPCSQVQHLLCADHPLAKECIFFKNSERKIAPTVNRAGTGTFLLMLCKTLPSPFDVLKFDILTRKTGFFQKVAAVWSFIKRHLQALLSSLFPSSLARSLFHCSPAFLARLYYSIEPLNSLRIRGRFVFQCDGRNLSPSPALLARPLKKITGAYAKASTTRSFLCKRSRVLLNLMKYKL